MNRTTNTTWIGKLAKKWYRQGRYGARILAVFADHLPNEVDSALNNRLQDLTASMTRLTPLAVLLRADTFNDLLVNIAHQMVLLSSSTSPGMTDLPSTIRDAITAEIQELVDDEELIERLDLDPSDEPEALVAVSQAVVNLAWSPADTGLRHVLDRVRSGLAAKESNRRALECSSAGRVSVTSYDFDDDAMDSSTSSTGTASTAIWTQSQQPVSLQYLPTVTPVPNLSRAIVASELAMWRRLSHPNVVPLLAVCLVSRQPFTIVPEMTFGDLVTYARTTRSPDQHVRLLLETARGMAYLHSRKLRHGRLCGRAVMVDAAGTAKVGGFLSGSDYFASCNDDTESYSSVRWMGPECYDLYHHSTRYLESDVYAFAMVVYEVVSGRVPFHNLHGGGTWCDVLISRLVSDGVRPVRPLDYGHVAAASEVSDDALWALVEQCWRGDMAERPTFPMIVATLEALRDRPPHVTASVDGPMGSALGCTLGPGDSVSGQGVANSRDSLPAAAGSDSYDGLPADYYSSTFSETSDMVMVGHDHDRQEQKDTENFAELPSDIGDTSKAEFLPFQSVSQLLLELFPDLEFTSTEPSDQYLWEMRYEIASGTRSGIDFRCRTLTRTGAEILKRYMAGPLDSLFLDYVIFDDGALLQDLCAHLPRQLRKLSMNGVSSVKIAPALALHHPPQSLVYLNLGNNRLGDEGAKLIADVLPPTLRDLVLSSNEIDAPGARAIAARFPPSLVWLDFDRNCIDDKGAKAIAAKIPPRIQRLYLSANGLTDVGAWAVARAVPRSCVRVFFHGDNDGHHHHHPRRRQQEQQQQKRRISKKLPDSDMDQNLYLARLTAGTRALDASATARLGLTAATHDRDHDEGPDLPVDPPDDDGPLTPPIVMRRDGPARAAALRSGHPSNSGNPRHRPVPVVQAARAAARAAAASLSSSDLQALPPTAAAGYFIAEAAAETRARDAWAIQYLTGNAAGPTPKGWRAAASMFQRQRQQQRMQQRITLEPPSLVSLAIDALVRGPWSPPPPPAASHGLLPGSTALGTLAAATARASGDLARLGVNARTAVLDRVADGGNALVPVTTATIGLWADDPYAESLRMPGIAVPAAMLAAVLDPPGDAFSMSEDSVPDAWDDDDVEDDKGASWPPPPTPPPPYYTPLVSLSLPFAALPGQTVIQVLADSRRCQPLLHLDLTGLEFSRASDAGAALAKLSGALTHLESLDLHYCRWVSVRALAAVDWHGSGWRNMARLGIACCVTGGADEAQAVVEWIGSDRGAGRKWMIVETEIF
ncbi:hypothetical protein BC828DRAFT_408545 [Blastocladiella britannica]|nr:hypothetical protein BC828DRAFT_408545 [Blastocladiella britannica]